MDDSDWLTVRFEAARPHLRAVAYRMLGSYAEADDAVQETWLRLHRAEPDRVENLTGWLTTIVGRVCLDRLRSRQARRDSRWVSGLPSRCRREARNSIPNSTRCSPRPSAPPCSWCLTRSARPSGWCSSCMTSSRCRFPRSRRSSTAPRRRPVNSQVAPDAGCTASRQTASQISLASARSSTPSSPHPAAATSTHCSRCSTPTSPSEPTTSPCASAPRPKPTAHRRWPERPLAARGRAARPHRRHGRARLGTRRASQGRVLLRLHRRQDRRHQHDRRPRTGRRARHRAPRRRATRRPRTSAILTTPLGTERGQAHLVTLRARDPSYMQRANHHR